jgi:hypothetical protein
MTSLQSWQNTTSADISGNAPQELKDMIFGIFAKYFWTPHVGKFFGSPILQGVRIERVSVDEDLDCPSGSNAQTSVACRFVVTPGAAAKKSITFKGTLTICLEMCDHQQKMHGGCLAFLTDM